LKTHATKELGLAGQENFGAADKFAWG